MAQYRCVIPLEVPEVFDDSYLETGEIIEVKEGSLWYTDGDGQNALMLGEVRLESQSGTIYWIEISKEQFEEHFVLDDYA